MFSEEHQELLLWLQNVKHLSESFSFNLSPVCQTAVCPSRRRAAGRSREAVRTDPCRWRSVWTSARAGYSHYRHNTQAQRYCSALALLSIIGVCVQDVMSLTPAQSHWPAGAGVSWLCWRPWRDPSVRSQPEIDSLRPDPAVSEESLSAHSLRPDHSNKTQLKIYSDTSNLKLK